MSIDGGLRKLFIEHIKPGHVQAVETGGVGLGIPDFNYCVEGVEGWVECKQTGGWALEIRPEQVAWAERRLRNGGRVFVAVRRRHDGGIRRGGPVDELIIFSGHQTRALALSGIKGVACLGQWHGGPARWDWEHVKEVLRS